VSIFLLPPLPPTPTLSLALPEPPSRRRLHAFLLPVNFIGMAIFTAWLLVRLLRSLREFLDGCGVQVVLALWLRDYVAGILLGGCFRNSMASVLAPRGIGITGCYVSTIFAPIEHALWYFLPPIFSFHAPGKYAQDHRSNDVGPIVKIGVHARFFEGLLACKSEKG
jgi:hypothetical protein